MMKIFDKFVFQRRYFVVMESEMIEVVKMVQLALMDGYCRDSSMSIGNCGWANEPDAWFIHVTLSKHQWRTLLRECKNKKYQLVVKEEPDNMYFTKLEESN